MSFTPPEARLKATCGALERFLRDMPVLPALPALEETSITMNDPCFGFF